MAFTATTTNSAAAWRPDIFEFAPIDIVPDALILRCSTVAGTVEGDAPVARVAYVVDDTAQISVEADAIPESDPVLSERLVHTSKVTQLVRLSREQYQQAGTAGQLATSVARAITRRTNLAFVSENAPTAPAVAPVAGLINTNGLIDGGAIANNLDPLIDLIARLETNLATPSHPRRPARLGRTPATQARHRRPEHVVAWRGDHRRRATPAVPAGDRRHGPTALPRPRCRPASNRVRSRTHHDQHK
jgi:hypothetical protein